MTVHLPETDAFESIDIEIPCDHRTKRTICDEPAVWVLTLRPHCKVVNQVTLLICQRHYQFVVDGGLGSCACGPERIVIRDFVLRLEPL